MAEWTDPRKAIIDRLEKLGMTTNQLAERCGGSPSRARIYCFLRPKKDRRGRALPNQWDGDLSTRHLGRVFDVLGLVISDVKPRKKS